MLDKKAMERKYHERRKIEEYFYKVARENGLFSLMLVPSLKKKEEVDMYIKEILRISNET